MVNDNLVKQAVEKGMKEMFPDGVGPGDRHFKNYLRSSFSKCEANELQEYLDDKRWLDYDLCGNYSLKIRNDD